MTTDIGISLPDAAADLARRDRIDARDGAGERAAYLSRFAEPPSRPTAQDWNVKAQQLGREIADLISEKSELEYAVRDLGERIEAKRKMRGEAVKNYKAEMQKLEGGK